MRKNSFTSEKMSKKKIKCHFSLTLFLPHWITYKAEIKMKVYASFSYFRGNIICFIAVSCNCYYRQVCYNIYNNKQNI